MAHRPRGQALGGAGGQGRGAGGQAQGAGGQGRGAGGQDRGPGGVPNAVPRRRQARTPPSPRRDVLEPNLNRAPSNAISPSKAEIAAYVPKKEQKRYRVKESELTGNDTVDTKNRDLAEYFNSIQDERLEYLKLKHDGANKRELEGKMLRILGMVEEATRMRKAITDLGAQAIVMPKHFPKEPRLSA